MLAIIPILKKLYEYRGTILTVGFIILIILLSRQCNRLSYIEHKVAQNEAYYKEEIQRHVTKDGRVESEKAILLTKMSELKNDTSRLAREILTLKKDGSKPKIVIVTKIVYVDSGSVNNSISQLDSNKYSVNFEYLSDDHVIFLKGRNQFFADPYKTTDNKIGLRVRGDKSYFDSITVNIDLTLGIKKDGDIDRVFAKTNSPRISITQLDAAEVEDYYKDKYAEKKSKRIGIGPYVGFGVTAGQNGLNYGPTFGIGVQYNFIRF